MKKIFCYLCFIIFQSVYISAINPYELINLPFTFNHLYTNNWGFLDDIKLDCFYNYSSSKPLSKQKTNSNRYYSINNLTIRDSIYKHRFVGARFIDEPQNGSYFIMTDDKGDSLFMAFPKYNPNKEYDSYKKSYAYKNIRTLKKEHHDYKDIFHTGIDLTVFPLHEFESMMSTILSTQNNDFLNDALPIPVFHLLGLEYQSDGTANSVPYKPLISLIKNNTDTLTNLSVSDIEYLSSEISEDYRKISVLKEYVDKFDYSIIDSISTFLNQDIWIDSKILNSAIFVSNNPNGHKVYSSKIKYNHWDYNFSDDAKWAYKSEGYLSSAAFGGKDYLFGYAHADTIVLKPNLRTVVEKLKFEKDPYNKKSFSPTDSLEFRFYLALTRCPDSTYVDFNEFDRKYYTQIGKECNDTIFIEIEKNTPKYLLSTQSFNNVKAGFYEREQYLWDEFSEEQKAYVEIATRMWGEKIAQIVCSGEVRLGFDEEMCHFAFMRTPFRTSSVQTPLGLAECQDFFMEGIRLYFQNKILIGIEWRGNKLFEPRHRF